MTTTEQKYDLPFWDTAEVEEPCLVPCWPVYSNGDGYDCPVLLRGVLLEHRWFQATEFELPPFDPGMFTYECPLHNGVHELKRCGQ